MGSLEKYFQATIQISFGPRSSLKLLDQSWVERGLTKRKPKKSLMSEHPKVTIATQKEMLVLQIQLLLNFVIEQETSTIKIPILNKNLENLRTCLNFITSSLQKQKPGKPDSPFQIWLNE